MHDVKETDKPIYQRAGYFNYDVSTDTFHPHNAVHLRTYIHTEFLSDWLINITKLGVCLCVRLIT
jgi:hypothetical protein